MHEYKLQYASRKSLNNALESRGVLVRDLDNNLVYGEHTQAVVYLGHIMLERGEYDSEGVEIVPPSLSSKYHCDIMTSKEFSFGSNEVVLEKGQSPAHTFKL